VRVTVTRDAGETKAPVSHAAPSAAADALGAVRGGVVLIPRDGVSTDAIWPASLTYTDDVSKEDMVRAVFRNLEPRFASIARRGDIVVAGRNFGGGSSREQAVTALDAFGIRAVVAASIARTFRRNALNNGFAVIECAELVAALRARFAAPPNGASSPDASARAAPSPGAPAATSSSRVDPPVFRPGIEISIDFDRAVIAALDTSFEFAPLSAVERRLLSAGGLGPLVRAVLASGAAFA
jgi:3-isopropylmalate dehydratase small subunit